MAAVNGPVIGIGLTMILPFDRIVVADGAKLSVRFVKMGVVPELASSMYLPMRCGWGAASDLMLSGRTIDAAEALALGLADEVVEPERLIEAAIERARSYGENPAPVAAVGQAAAQRERQRDRHHRGATSRGPTAAQGLRHPRAS